MVFEELRRFSSLEEDAGPSWAVYHCIDDVVRAKSLVSALSSRALAMGPR